MESHIHPRQSSPWTVAIKSMARRTARPFAIICIGGVTLILVILSPLALKAMTTGHNINWPQLSNIGQAYGAISAILSALALVAISASIGIQAKEGLANRRHVQRELHMRLTELAMSDPLYMQHWGPQAHERLHDESRRLQFANLMVSFWYMSWELGDMPSETLSNAAKDLFDTKEGRDYWHEFRDGWSTRSIGSRLDRFHQIIDKTFHEALGSNRPINHVQTAKAAEPSTIHVKEAVGVAAAISISFAGGFIVRKALQRWGLQ